MKIGRKSRRRRRPTLFERHPGQAIVIIALVMIVLLGFVALAIDGGQLYFLQRDAQNAADAAIMAALFELCKDPNLDTDNIVSDGKTGNQIRAENAIRAGKQAAIENGFDQSGDGYEPLSPPPTRSLASDVQVTVTVPYNPGTGLSYNNVEVVIVASKPSELIHLVYQGPLQVRARTAGYCRSGHAFTQDYAMFGGASGCNPGSVNFQGSGTEHPSDIVGGIGANGDIALSGGGTSVDTCTATGTIDPGYCDTTTSSPGITMPQIWNLDDFDLTKGGEWAKIANDLGQYHYYNGDLKNPDTLPKVGGAVEPGIYFINGNFQMQGNDFGSQATNVTIVTTGSFTISGGIDVPFTAYSAMGLPPMPLVFSNAGDGSCTVNTGISMSGSGIFWEGVLYAPNGLIDLTGSVSGTLNGCMIGAVVSVRASEFDITCSPTRFPPVKPAIDITG